MDGQEWRSLTLIRNDVFKNLGRLNFLRCETLMYVAPVSKEEHHLHEHRKYECPIYETLLIRKDRPTLNTEIDFNFSIP